MAAFKLKLTDDIEETLQKVENELKKRGIRDFDPSDLICQLIRKIPPSVWEQEIEKRTPLEYRIQLALLDPNMRETLEKLLCKKQPGRPRKENPLSFEETFEAGLSTRVSPEHVQPQAFSENS